MRRNDIELGTRHRWLIYVGTTVLAASGLVWWALDRFGQIEGAFGSVKSPWQHPALVVHGVAALAYLLLLGSLTTVHIRRGWALKRQRVQAALLFTLQTLLVLTAGALYYVGDETARGVVSTTHLLAGLLLIAMLPLHIFLGRRATLRAP